MPGEAENCYEQALFLQPEYPDCTINLGNALKDQGKVAEALTHYERALQLRPQSVYPHYNRAVAWLLAGDYERGWPEYEWRLQLASRLLPPFPAPLWDGSRLDGRAILVRAEQGLGDTVQFVR